MRFRPGQHVEVRDEVWEIVRTDWFDEIVLVTLRGVGADNLGESARVLVPFDRVTARRVPSRLVRRPRSTVLGLAASHLAHAPRWDDSWTAAAARIDLRSWQIEPALAAVRGTPRILLADEVGLGKTIQAILIVAELMARGLAQRVLVLTPASLREQWAAEMRERFGLGATIFDQATLASTMARLPPGINPWLTAPLIVSSIDLVKRPEVRAALDLVPIDLLIVDEAHHLTPGSDRGAVVSDMAARAATIVLVTATPHSGDDAAYRFLCAIGDLGGERRLVRFRRTARQLGLDLRRHTRILAVRPTTAERALLEATVAYARALWCAPGATGGARLVASVIARRACSAADAARVSLARRLSLLNHDPPPDTQATLPWEDGEDDATTVPDAVLATAGLRDRDREIAWLTHLVKLAKAAVADGSKIAVIGRLLRLTREHLVVFSEYRDVVEIVASRLEHATSVAVLHGGMSPMCRREILQRFGDGQVRMLVTTDAAGEGLNLQAQCRLVVNLELPWNPLRIEQRIGRVDRLGQKRRVHALHLVHRGSFEDTVLARFERRRMHARTGLKQSEVVTEAAIAAAVFESGNEPSRKPGASLSRGDESLGSSESSWEPSFRTVASSITPQNQRRLGGLAAHRSRTSPLEGAGYAVAPPRGRVARSVVLLFGADIVDATHRLIQREIVPLRVTMVAACPQRLTRRLVRRLIDEPRVQARVVEVLAARQIQARERVRDPAHRIDVRARAILSALMRREGRHLYQASLFDRRDERRSHARAAAREAWRRHVEHRLAAARALNDLSATPPRLLAAWLDR